MKEKKLQKDCLKTCTLYMLYDVYIYLYTNNYLLKISHFS